MASQLPMSTRRLETNVLRTVDEVDGGGKAHMRMTRKGANELKSPALKLRRLAAKPLIRLAGASLAMMTLCLAAHATAAGDPLALVKTTVNQVVSVLQDKATPQQARRDRLVDLVAGRFDFADMARQSLGTHWNQLTPAQRNEFVPLFTSFMEAAYLDKIEDYSGQPIQFIKESSDGPGYAQVSTSVIQQDKQPIHIDYRLKQAGGEWRVYDVTVDDISITANYRNQFNRVIDNQGYDALVTSMRNKERELHSELAS
jgi:phospholipid transport system substrate-binding protein